MNRTGFTGSNLGRERWALWIKSLKIKSEYSNIRWGKPKVYPSLNYLFEPALWGIILTRCVFNRKVLLLLWAFKIAFLNSVKHFCWSRTTLVSKEKWMRCEFLPRAQSPHPSTVIIELSWLVVNPAETNRCVCVCVCVCVLGPGGSSPVLHVNVIGKYDTCLRA